MKNYRDMFLALFITLQEVQYPDSVKTSKHWNRGYNKKRSINHRKDAHVW